MKQGQFSQEQTVAILYQALCREHRTSEVAFYCGRKAYRRMPLCCARCVRGRSGQWDFIFDVLVNGNKRKILTIGDDFTQERLAI